MRLTQKLCAQHLDWWFKQKWKRSCQRGPTNDGAFLKLQNSIKSADNAQYVLNSSQFLQRSGPLDKSPVQFPAAYTFCDQNVLIGGLLQAQALLKTIVINEFPKQLDDKIRHIVVPFDVHAKIKSSVVLSHLLDSEQKKNGKISGVDAVVPPCTYSMTEGRKIHLITSRLLAECEKLSNSSVVTKRHSAQNLKYILNLVVENKALQFAFNIDTLITSEDPLNAWNYEFNEQLPKWYPMHRTVSIPRNKQRVVHNIFPFSHTSPHPHTIVSYFLSQETRNLYGLDVSDSQFEARNMLKAFSVAALRAKQLYGEQVATLEQPIVVQSVHTNGKFFNFGIFELNSLELDDQNDTKNYWFYKPTSRLFHECKYEDGRVLLEGYNENILKYLKAFYCNS